MLSLLPSYLTWKLRLLYLSIPGLESENSYRMNEPLEGISQTFYILALEGIGKNID